MIHHGNKKIEKYNDVDYGISAKHEHSPEASKDLDAIKLEALEINEAENSPEESLSGLEQAAIIRRIRGKLYHFVAL